MDSIWTDATYRALIERTSGYMPPFVVKFVTVIGGTTYTIDSSSIKQISFKTDSVSGSQFSFGDFIGRSCELTFFDIDGDYASVALNGAYGTLSYGTKKADNSVVWISYGTFVIDSAKRTGGTVWLQMSDLRKRFAEVGFTPSASNLTLYQLAVEVCAAANVVAGLPTVALGNTSLNMPNGSIATTNAGSVEIKNGNSPVKLSQIVSYIAQAAGCFAIIGNDDKLYFRWYSSPANAFTITSDLVPDRIEVSEYDVNVTGVEWVDASQTRYTNGTDGYKIIISDNPLTFSNYATLLTGIATRVVGFTYTPLKFTYVGNPAVEVGDIISVVDDNAVTHSFPITNMTYSDLLSQEIVAANGSPADVNVGALTITQQIQNSANNVIAYARIMEVEADRVKVGGSGVPGLLSVRDASNNVISTLGTDGVKMFDTSGNQIGGNALIGSINSFVAGAITDDPTDPLCWSIIGSATIDGTTHRGIFTYVKGTTNPVLRFTYDGISSVNVVDKNGKTRMRFGNDIAIKDGGGDVRLLIEDDGSTRIYAKGTHQRFGFGTTTPTVVSSQDASRYISVDNAGIKNSHMPLVGTYPIVERGSNSNGTYIKFADGTMICTKKVILSNVNINNANGALFYAIAIDLGLWAQAFIGGEPTYSITTKSSPELTWHSITIPASETNCPYIVINSAQSVTGVAVHVEVTGISRWV